MIKVEIQHGDLWVDGKRVTRGLHVPIGAWEEEDEDEEALVASAVFAERSA